MIEHLSSRVVAASTMMFALAAVPRALGVDAATAWSFNVFSRSTIGTSTGGYGSSIAGTTGAVGDAWFSSISLRPNSISTTLPCAFYGGGAFTLSGSVGTGGVCALGHVLVNNASITGDVRGGGNLGGTGGSVTGNVTITGTKTTGNPLTVTGTVTSGTAYSAPVDLAAISQYFLDVSTAVGALNATTTYTSQWGKITVPATGSLTIVSMSGAELNRAWGLEVSGSGVVVINITGTSATLSSKTWSFIAGASANTTLVNFPQATSVTLTGSHTVSFLAPQAAVAYSSGGIQGSLVAGSLTGSGSFTWNGGFTGASALPGVTTQHPRIVRWRETVAE